MKTITGVLNRILAAANSIGIVDTEEYALVQAFVARLYSLEDKAKEHEAVLKRCKFPGYIVETGQDTVNYVQVTYLEPDVFKGIVEIQKGRRWILEDDSVPIQVVQTLFKALSTSMEHRLRENFTVDKQAILNPHHDLNDLLKIAEKREHEAIEIPFKLDAEIE